MKTKIGFTKSPNVIKYDTKHEARTIMKVGITMKKWLNLIKENDTNMGKMKK